MHLCLCACVFVCMCGVYSCVQVFECVSICVCVCVYSYKEIWICFIVVPVISIGFSSRLINGSESRGSSRFQVSWSVSGNAPMSTDYYILPLMYKKDFDADDGTLTAKYSQILGHGDYDLPAAAVEGIGNKEIELCCDKVFYCFFSSG